MPTIQQGVEPQAPVAISVRTTALQFLRWSHDHGLLAGDAYYPGETFGVPEFDGSEVEAAALGILRSRQIRFVAIDEAAQKISVFLRKASPTSKELKALPSSCNGVALHYHQGNSETVSPTTVAEATSTCALHIVGGNSFYTCGSSISVGNNREAGTFGCLVSDNAGQLYGLTNNHVSGACNYAPTGLPIIAPGVLDVGPSNPHPFTIGSHVRQLPMLVGDPSSVDHAMNSDAALFEIASLERVSSMQRGFYDTPQSVTDMAPGMHVQKVGRTTALTNGVVLAEVVGAMGVSYTASQYGFAGVVYFEPLFVVHGLGDIFSEGGDSGSLVTHVDAQGVRHAVGMVVAGCADNSAPGGKRSFVLPLRQVLNRFNVALVAGHNC
jgi:hypothetical protein